MSHSKERVEKVCLNCGVDVIGRYCHTCGQENMEPKETAWGLITHFMYDITHFDGKFFNTLKYLAIRPGFLPKQYIAGRRARYLHPIRMYVFTSALFFIVFYSVVNVKDFKTSSKLTSTFADSARIKIANARVIALESANNTEDSLRIMDAFDLMEKAKISNDTSTRKSRLFGLKFAQYESRATYDSSQKATPVSERDGWFKRMLIDRILYVNETYGDDEKRFWRDVLDRFIHTFPYLLFVSLPLYALFLKLLYIRRKHFFYVDHGIFLIYLYIFTFIALLIMFACTKLDDYPGFGWISLITAALILYGIWYTVKAMRNFYQQGWWKTIAKFILFNIICQITLTVLFSLFFAITIFRI